MASYIQPNKMLLWEHGKGEGHLTNLKRQCRVGFFCFCFFNSSPLSRSGA